MKNVDTAQIEYIRSRLQGMARPVVIVGMMGCGKSRTGRILANILDLALYDSDEEIIAAAGMPISDIFEKFGESYFRDGERRVMQRLLEQGACVIATGGGAVTNDETLALIKEKAISVWIKADIDVIVERTSRTDKRPLLQNGNPRDILQGLLDNREDLYAQADIEVISDDDRSQDTIKDLLNKLEEFLRV